MRKHQQNPFTWRSASFRSIVMPGAILLVSGLAPGISARRIEAQQPAPPAASTSATVARLSADTEFPISPDDGHSDPAEDMVQRIGFNAAVIFDTTHDSESGWSSTATPYVSYTFTRNYSADISCPIYFFRHAESTEATVKPGTTPTLVTLRGETGNTLVSTHAAFSNRLFDYMATLSATGPSGDTTYGLSTGRVTFDLTHDFTHYFGIFGPGVELGVGDSNTFANTKVVKDFVSLGPLAHFQAGSTFDLPLHSVFEADYYEELPIGDQKIYSTVVLRHHTTTEVTGTSVSEDNGATFQLDIPVVSQMVLSGYYNYSRRFGIDTAGLAITFLLRNPRMVSREAREQRELDNLMR